MLIIHIRHPIPNTRPTLTSNNLSIPTHNSRRRTWFRNVFMKSLWVGHSLHGSNSRSNKHYLPLVLCIKPNMHGNDYFIWFETVHSNSTCNAHIIQISYIQANNHLNSSKNDLCSPMSSTYPLKWQCSVFRNTQWWVSLTTECKCQQWLLYPLILPCLANFHCFGVTWQIYASHCGFHAHNMLLEACFYPIINYRLMLSIRMY